MVLEESAFDYGSMNQGEELKHDFVIHNKGHELLVLEEIILTCGCTVVMPDTKEIPPGGSGRLTVVFRSGSFSGPVERLVGIRSNDPVRPSVAIRVRANVRPVFIVEPPVIAAGDVERGRECMREAVITDAHGKPFRVKALAVSHPDLKAELLPAGDQSTAVPGGANPVHRLRLTLNPKRNTGPFDFSVTVQTDRADAPQPVVLINGFVKGPVQVSPPAAFLGSVAEGQPFRPRVFTVTNSGPTAVEILRVDTGDASVNASVTTNTPGRSFQVRLMASPRPPGWFQRTMRITTTESEVPLEVPFSGVVMRPTDAVLQ